MVGAYSHSYLPAKFLFIVEYLFICTIFEFIWVEEDNGYKIIHLIGTWKFDEM